MGTDAPQNPTPTTTPATDASPFHAIPGHETIQAAPKSVYQAGPSGAAHGKAGSMGSAAPEKSFVGENIDKLTEPIENYTPAGRAEHPILSRLGDVTRGVKELLEGGQTPMGAQSGVMNNPATAMILPETQGMVEEGLAAKGEEGLAEAARGAKGAASTAAKYEGMARQYIPAAASRVAEAGHTFLQGLVEEGRNAYEATAPAGSTEAGFAKIPGYRSEQPKIGATVSGEHVVTHIQNTSHNPFGTGDYKISREEAHQLAGLDSGGDYKLQRVPIDSVKATNDTDPALAQQYAKKKSPLPAVVLDMDGNIRDGNHRLAAAKLRGDKDVLAYVPQDSYEAPTTKPAKLTPPVEVNPDAEATKKAEADLAAARANYVHDMEKNPTTFPKGTPVHEQVVNVDPNKVIAKVNPGGNTFDEPTVQKYQRMIRNGEDIPAARIEYGKTGDLRGYDGRHRVEAARREGAPVKLWTRREVEPGEAPPTTIGHEEPQVHELNGDETPESANGNIPESQQAATEEEGAYHPDLQAVADKYGTSEDPHKVGNGASFIAPDGKYIHLGSTQHPEAIEKATGERAAEDMKAVGENMQRSNGPEDSRVRFLADTGAIRTRATFGRAGHTLHISVPEKGVTPDQVDALKGAARAALGSGKSGHIVMEIGVPGGKSATAEFANANNIEPMLKEIGAHPDKTPTEAPNWNEKAAQLHEQNGGFTINPRTGAVPESGHIVEAVPEARQVSDKPNTPAQIQKYADSKPVKKLLAKYPELQIGGYKNDAGKYELNLSAISNDSAKAAKVAKALDQESVYNAGEGKVVPTGGKNTQQKFPDYTIAQRLRDLAPEEPGMTISTRQPSSVKYSTEDPLRHNLRLTDDLINKNPALADKWAEVVKNYPGFQAPEGATTEETLNAFIEHAKDNLKHLYNSLPPEEQEKNKVWYDGAHQLTKDLADQHGLTHPQTAGIVASLSPQKDWDQNVSLARRLTSIMKNQQNTKAGSEMLAKAKDIKNESWTKQNPQANDYLVSLAKKIQGKTLGELKDPMQKAAFVRLHDEVNNPREYFKINPDGSNAGVYKKADGTSGKVAWGSLDEIGKAVNIFEDGSRDNLSANLGQAHKVRHFYNNIIEPNSARGDVTVDTHAVAAALMRALSGKNAEVLTNFSGPGSNIHGLNGTYPLYHEAYTRAAKELDIAHPRQLQSVVWEHIRNLFPAEFKTKENQAAIDGIWKEAQNGQITAEDARNKITQYAKEHSAGSDEAEQHPADQSELSGNSVHGESAGGRGRGDRGVNPVGNQETRPAESNAKAGSGWLKMMQSASPKKNEFLK